MNVMDRSLSSAADHDLVKARLAATRKRRRAIALGIVAVLIAAAIYYVWAMTLCGDCGGAPLPLPPPPT
jgi:hypothetical protein